MLVLVRCKFEAATLLLREALFVVCLYVNSSQLSNIKHLMLRHVTKVDGSHLWCNYPAGFLQVLSNCQTIKLNRIGCQFMMPSGLSRFGKRQFNACRHRAGEMAKKGRDCKLKNHLRAINDISSFQFLLL
jgi:hypothetical protein